MANPRKLAASVLTKIEKDLAYSNITLSASFKDVEITAQEKKLTSALVYGVLDRKITLDYVLSRFMKTPIKKTAPFTLSVLRTALYQIMFMDKIPESAAVNEAVKLIKKSKENRNAGFVNGVLRSILRAQTLLPQGESANDLSIIYSCPLWIVESFLKDYGTKTAIELLKESLKAPKVNIKVNNTRITAEELLKKLCDSGIDTIKGEIENCLVLNSGTAVGENECFKNGLFHVQDSASQRAVAVLAPKKGERVLDMCAAPGGKSFTMAENMENCGEIVSCDMYEHKLKLISDSAERLGLDIIKPTLNDATRFNPDLGEFDAILCDVPCSGFGVIRRKPEIKYKPQEDFSELEKIQQSILCCAAGYLKKGGRILYSTCTLRRGENEDNVAAFLQNHKDFVKEYEHTFMPHTDNTDGFYCALLVKSR